MKVLLVKIPEEKIVKNKDKRIPALIPPTDPRVLMQIAPFFRRYIAQSLTLKIDKTYVML